MTVNNSNSFITIAGDGVTTSFNFNFIGVAQQDISVILDLNLTGQITLNANQYNLFLNPAAPGQIWGVGGVVVYPLVGSPLAAGHTLTIQRIVPLLQTVAFSNQGANLGTAVEQALDLVEMQIQQVSNDAGQSIPGATGPSGAAGPAGPVPRSYLAGLGLSNDIASPANTIDIAVGQCISDDQSTTITLAAPFTKLINGLWVPGSGGAGLDAGSVVSLTFYFVFIIYNPTLALTDILFSLSATSPTMPAGYTFKRCIGAMFTNGSAHWAAFTQTGDTFILGSPQASLVFQPTGSMTAYALNFIPRGISVKAILQGSANAPGLGSLFIQETVGLNSGAPTVSTIVTGVQNAFGRIEVQTNTLGQVYIGSSTANLTAIIVVMGWVDRRGRDA